MRETQESGEESPPAFRPTQNTSNTSTHKRRKSRKEIGAASAPSGSASSVAGSNRKGGSLQNISTHSQRSVTHFEKNKFGSIFNGFFCSSEWGSVRRRKRHDTSDSGSALGSPRKREGGSLPCDVARGCVKATNDPVSSSQANPVLARDFVIDIDEMMESTHDRRIHSSTGNIQLMSENSI